MLPTPGGDNPSSLSPAHRQGHIRTGPQPLCLSCLLALKPKKHGYLAWDLGKFRFNQFLSIKFLTWAGNPCATASSQTQSIWRLGSWCPLEQPSAFLVNHKRSGPATRQPLWGAGCQAATPASKDCQAHSKSGLPGFWKSSSYSPFPSPLQDQRSQSHRSFQTRCTDLFHTCFGSPWILWEVWAHMDPCCPAHFQRSCSLRDSCIAIGLLTSYKQDKPHTGKGPIFLSLSHSHPSLLWQILLLT